MKAWIAAVCFGCSMLSAAPLLAEPPRSESVTAMASLGVGVPELLHAGLGYFLLDRLTIEAQFKSVVFNSMIGVGATGHLLGDAPPGRPPRHAMLASASVLVNPTLGELRVESRGDVLAAGVGAYLGYGFLADSGFLFRVLAGSLFFEDNGFAAGPGISLHVGFAL